MGDRVRAEIQEHEMDPIVDQLNARLDALERSACVHAPAKASSCDSNKPKIGAMEMLTQRVEASSSLLCVGLDPHMQDIGTGTANEARDFCIRLVAATAEFAACFKPNSAFFEQLGTADLQELKLADGRMLYEEVACAAARWNDHGNIGLVVGATHPKVMVHVRSLVPDMWILAPGIGAQGGDLEKTVHAGVRADCSGLLINVSRGISRASDPAAAARKFRDDINEARQTVPAAASQASALKAYQTEFIQLALQHEVLRFGDFTLKS